MGFLDELTNLSDTSIDGKKPPSTKFADWFHQRVSASRDTDLHHQLGSTEGTAARGSHTHDGKNSKPLWAVEEVPVDLPASPTNAQFRDATNAILAMMRQKAG